MDGAGTGSVTACKAVNMLRKMDVTSVRFGWRNRFSMDTFDWHKDDLSYSTLITASYKNTQNVRRFFKLNCGEDFKFDRDFMQWMKAAQGLTIGDAIEEWLSR